MSLAGITDRILAIEAKIDQLSGLTATDQAAGQAFGTELTAAMGTADSSVLGRISASGLVGAAGTSSTDPSAQALQQRVIAAAETALGLPYVWGGNSLTKGVDCSGLVQQSFRTIGIELPRLSADQARSGEPVASMDQAQPGDLIAWDNSSRNNGADHIAIYLGDGKMIESPYTGARVRIVDVPTTPDYIRRVIPQSAATLTAASAAPALTVAAPATIGSQEIAAIRSSFELQSLFSGVN